MPTAKPLPLPPSLCHMDEILIGRGITVSHESQRDAVRAGGRVKALPPSSFVDRRIIDPEFSPKIPEPLLVHPPPVLQEQSQAFQPGLGEERRRPSHRV